MVLDCFFAPFEQKNANKQTSFWLRFVRFQFQSGLQRQLLVELSEQRYQRVQLEREFRWQREPAEQQQQVQRFLRPLPQELKTKVPISENEKII